MADDNQDEFSPSHLKERLDELEQSVSSIPEKISEALKGLLEPLTNAPTKTKDDDGKKNDPPADPPADPPKKSNWGGWWSGHPH